MPETPSQERGPLTYLTLVCPQEELKGRPPPYPSPHLAQGAAVQNNKEPAAPDRSRVTPGQGRVSSEQGSPSSAGGPRGATLLSSPDFNGQSRAGSIVCGAQCRTRRQDLCSKMIRALNQGQGPSEHRGHAAGFIQHLSDQHLLRAWHNSLPPGMLLRGGGWELITNKLQLL